jgi:mannose-6-phosphate isomerase-like protein (cupin superfamily)
MPIQKDNQIFERPWGMFEIFVTAKNYQVKRLTVYPKGKLSLQSHNHRSEHWVVVHGTAKVTNGENSLTLAENESTFIPVGHKHRLENPGKDNLEIIEVQTGDYLGEDDIIRYEDIYDRTSKDLSKP